MKQVVLVIEDNDGVRENISEILSLSNYNVFSASNGKEGLELVRKTPPDIILCDVMMPELDGYGVLRALNNDPSTQSIPFVFVTAKSEKKDFRKGMDLGADDYLIKPFTGDDLLSMINTRIKKAEAIKSILKNNIRIDESLSNHSISAEDIYKMTDKIIIKKLRKKDMLFSEGDSAKYLHFVVSGKIKLFRTNDQGKEYITQIFKEKDFFGYSSLLESNLYEESAVAIEDSEIGSILKQDFYQLLLSNNDLHAQFIKFVASNLSEANDKLIKLAYNSARKRVAEAILYLGNKYYEELSDDIIFSVCRDDISAISGVSPESVSRNLTDLRTERLIELQTGKIKILNLKKLATLKN